MGLLVLALTWPLLLLVAGFVVIAAIDVFDIGFFSWILIWPIAIAFAIYFLTHLRRAAKAPGSSQEEEARRSVLVFSLAILIPLFVRAMIQAANAQTAAVFTGLIAGFAVITWGMFIKGNHVVSRANLLGGVITVFYTYFQLWELGPGARIGGAAIGLVAAVLVASIKYKDKLS